MCILRSAAIVICLCFYINGHTQVFDTAKYRVTVRPAGELNNCFKHDASWRGADGASSVDLGNGKVLWLFSDSFISTDSPGTRKNAVIVRNSIAIQQGYDLPAAAVKFYWNKAAKEPGAFFHVPGRSWFWTGHGIMIKDRLILFLLKEEERAGTGPGFQATGWYAALIGNPAEDPVNWKIKYIEGRGTFGTIAGSAALLKDGNYLYAFGAVEPDTHEVYVLRWKLGDAYAGHLEKPEWWINGKWSLRKNRYPLPTALFTGSTEYSVHYNSSLKKFIHVQAFGFGEARIGIRMSDSLQGPWTEPYMIHTPDYRGIKKPFMYAARAHPELHTDGFCITYNINSFDIGELVRNQTIYFPMFITVKITRKDDQSCP